MSKGEATWPATSVSLISGERDAVLIDAALTPEDASRVVDWIRATGKNLTTVYITHGQTDHFFGLNTILGAWLAFTDHDKRMQWIASIEQIEALNPAIVVTGHKRPDAPDDDPAAVLGGTKTYIRDFDQSLSGSHSAQELVDKMMVLHGDLGNPYTLWTAAQSVFEQGQGASS
jgi:glyoxylase-like metal-dependent hydrolase (beta-lactamase superfamily II)